MTSSLPSTASWLSPSQPLWRCLSWIKIVLKDVTTANPSWHANTHSLENGARIAKCEVSNCVIWENLPTLQTLHITFFLVYFQSKEVYTNWKWPSCNILVTVMTFLNRVHMYVCIHDIWSCSSSCLGLWCLYRAAWDSWTARTIRYCSYRLTKHQNNYVIYFSPVWKLIFLWSVANTFQPMHQCLL